MTDTPVKSILVVGAGTAGLMAALMLRRYNPDLAIEVIHSARIGHIMVGEGTVGSTPAMLHTNMGLDRAAFYENVRPTPKLGIRFLWGRRGEFHYAFDAGLSRNMIPGTLTPVGYGFDPDEPLVDFSFSSALISQDRVPHEDTPRGGHFSNAPAAYHFENALLVSHLMTVCRQQNITVTEAELEGVETGEAGITRVRCEGDRVFEADLYVDASGFAGALIHRGLDEPYVSMRDFLFCDRAVIGGWQRAGEPLSPCTTVETMDAGWCWRIEHRDIVNRGYVYCSDFIDDETAEAEFRRKNPKVSDTRIVRFETRRVRRPFVGNVVAIGNANGFVEPMEATNIQVILNFAHRLAVSLSGNRYLSDAHREMYNRYTENSWLSIRDFLALHYKYNDLLDTPFWRHARAETPLGGAEALVEYYRQVGPEAVGIKALLNGHDIFGADGYMTILHGCGVPYGQGGAVLPENRQRTDFIRQTYRRAAARCADPMTASIAGWAERVTDNSMDQSNGQREK